MTSRLDGPPFGAADLTNCERELIHLAGSIQPHGVLLVLREPVLEILQVSANSAAHLGHAPEALLGRRLAEVDAALARRLARLARESLLAHPTPLTCRLVVPGGGDGGAAGATPRDFDALVHRSPGAGLLLELEPALDATIAAAPTADGGDAAAGDPGDDASLLARALTAAIAGIRAAPDLDALGDAVVRHLRAITGYDRVMVYRFDADGHGEVVAEAHDPRFESFLGLHYPASDIPQRARELYLRNRVRVLVDVDYEPVPLVPRHAPHTGADVDLSLAHLRSMSPLHLQYLRNMGVTGTLVASLVRDGRLWGLIACHHYAPKAVPYGWRTACELLAEVISTRIAALETYAQANAVLQVRQLERRLIAATTATGDWRPALVDGARALFELLGAGGLALFHDGDIVTAGAVPSTSELRQLVAWLGRQPHDPLFHCASLAAAAPELAGLAPTASGVLSAALSTHGGEYLVWMRPEQRHTVRWAGDPHKPYVVGTGGARELSPRRSFAVWSELVRGTARPWTGAEQAIAATVRHAVADVALQVRAVRVLIAEQQASRVRERVHAAPEPTVIADGAGEILLANEAFQQLVHRPTLAPRRLTDLAPLFADPARARDILRGLTIARQPWRGELRLVREAGAAADDGVPVAVRADVIPGLQGDVLGYILICTDLTAHWEMDAERRRVRDAIFDTGRTRRLGSAAAAVAEDLDGLVTAILANTSAALDEIGTGAEPHAVPLLREVESSLRRAADLSAQMLTHASRVPGSSAVSSSASNSATCRSNAATASATIASAVSSSTGRASRAARKAATKAAGSGRSGNS